MLGILLVDKPAGMTSHDVVDALRRRFGTKRVGHAGTLDPLATGLLVVAVGPATRFLQFLPLEPKEYRAEIAFGRSTESYDAEGRTIEERPVPADLRSRLEETLPRFQGLQEQLPPMFSAVKVAGRPLYAYARKGKEVERQPRTIHIQELELESVEAETARIRLVCSGGTYVRTLAHDLGERVGCGAHLSSLRRTRVGRFSLEGAAPLSEAGPERLIRLREALPPLPIVEVSPEQARAVRDGQTVILPQFQEEGLVALAEPEQEVFSVARVRGNRVQPECVIPSEAFHVGS